MSKRKKNASKAAGCCPSIEDVLGTKLFKALCEPVRVALLVRQAHCREPSTVSQIARCCELDVSVVSRHLAMLREAGVLAAEKRGKKVYYSVRYAELTSTLRTMADAIEACCPADNPNCKENRDG